jgi:hypothetical protein
MWKKYTKPLESKMRQNIVRKNQSCSNRLRIQIIPQLYTLLFEHVGSDRSSESRLTQEPKELIRSPHIFPTNTASFGDLKTRSGK